MNKVQVSASVASVALLFLVVSLPRQPVFGQERPTSVTQKWEYKVVAKAVANLSPTESEAEFNELGAEGWELCATVNPAPPPGVAVVTFVFKRAKR